MDPLKVRFAYNGTLKHDHNKETAKFINKIVLDAFDDRHRQMSFQRFAESTVLPKMKTHINGLLLTDYKNIFEFVLGEHEPIQIKAPDEHMPEFTWEASFHLLSNIYTCIEILPDKIIVCYKEDNKEVLFVPLNQLKLIVV